MYLPNHFKIEDMAEIDRFVTANGFGVLVNVVDGAPFATHLPMQWVQHEDARLVQGHMAKANPQWRSFAADQEVLLIFTGPHGYISPRWYTPGQNVPTWNYTAVHVYGRPRIIEDAAEMQGLVKRLVDQYEADTGIAQPYRMEDMPADYIANMIRGTVGFEIAVTKIEAKYKLSQNRKPQDAHNVMATLDQLIDPNSQEMARMMHRIYD